MVDVHAEPLATLRQRTSEKWRHHGADVLPLFVAEMDYPVADPIREALVAQVQASDLGYVPGPAALPDAFTRFAERTWGWSVDRSAVRTTTDVSVAIVETLRQAISPGDGVVITPPVYPPFFDLVPEAGGQVVEVPLIDDRDDRAGSAQPWSLDLDGLERAFAAGARALLLCHPHNPLGLVHPRDQLAAVAELAEKYGVVVVSDEIHAPLTHPGTQFTPYLSVSPAAARTGVCVTSASKAWNLAGTKCALMVAADERTVALLDAMTYEVGFRTSILGLTGSVAAFEHGGPWLAGALAAIARSSALLAELLAEHLPTVTFAPPAASYLAWLDCRALGWGDDPSAKALATGVALNPGPSFGRQGVGHARLNLACSPEVLTEAIRRLASAV